MRRDVIGWCGMEWQGLTFMLANADGTGEVLGSLHMCGHRLVSVTSNMRSKVAMCCCSVAMKIDGWRFVKFQASHVSPATCRLGCFSAYGCAWNVMS